MVRNTKPASGGGPGNLVGAARRRSRAGASVVAGSRVLELTEPTSDGGSVIVGSAARRPSKAGAVTGAVARDRVVVWFTGPISCGNGIVV